MLRVITRDSLKGHIRVLVKLVADCNAVFIDSVGMFKSAVSFKYSTITQALWGGGAAITEITNEDLIL